MPSRPRLAALALALAAPAVAACGSDSGPVANATPVTVGGIGSPPPSLSSEPLDPMLPVTPGTFSTGDSIPERELPVGSFAEGNRVLLLGDSIFAGLSRRYTNLACSTLVPLGWSVAVEAESGRFVDFGLDVLEERPASTWDVAVVLLGTNYRRDQLQYAADLHQILDELGDRPVVLLTVTEHDPEIAEVNEVIAREVLSRDNVWVIDWASISQADGVLSGDGIHPTEQGRRLLAAAIAFVLGRAPTPTGQCLESRFTDDSAINGGSSSGSGFTAGSGSSSGNGSPGGGSTGGSPGGGSGATSVAPSEPPATEPPSTEPPATEPPVTEAPAGDATTASPTSEAETDG